MPFVSVSVAAAASMESVEALKTARSSSSTADGGSRPLTPMTPASSRTDLLTSSSSSHSLSTAGNSFLALDGPRASKKELKAWLLHNGFFTVSAQKVSTRSGRMSYPLHLAVKQKNPRMVQALLEAGADGRCKNSSGLTPMQLARRRNWRGSYDAVLAVLGKTVYESNEEDAEAAEAAAQPEGSDSESSSK
mmetsp:Transcript_55524/g.140724  ORF Transcript_55524/g.140724 Transcript_55524/m.140724 type:complete len:191 (+) Transcript_55524:80-652(+)